MALDPGVRARAAIHAALGDPIRLAIVEELVLADRTPSELRRRLGIESNLAAHHIRALEAAGLVERTASDGDRRRRYLRLLDATHAAVAPGTIAARNIVFVCSRNSARSQLAAALWNRSHDVKATSAGTRPADAVHPRALAAARSVGIDLGDARPRRLAELDETPDLVVTVCDLAHEELEDARVRELHWSTADPARDGRQAAFDRVLRALQSRIDRVAPLIASR